LKDTSGPNPDVALRPSGLPWFGQIPAHWKVGRLRFFCQSTQTGSTPSQEFMDCSAEDAEAMDWFTPGDFAGSLELRNSNRKISIEAGRLGEVSVFAAGTVFVVGIGATLGKVGFIRQSASANQQINAVIPRPDIAGELLAWVLSTLADIMSAMANSATLPILNQQRLGDLLIALPLAAAEQQAIVAHLAKETARLDGLLAAKERVLGLLAEKRRALITRAVTCGLDPRAPLRDSGIPWLGKIPANWSLIPLRFLVSMTSGGTPDTGKPEFWEGDIPWVSPKDMKKDEIEDAEDHISQSALSSSGLRMIEPPAVLVVVRGMILAHSFPTAITSRPVTINQDMKALHCRDLLEPFFLRDFLRGMETQLVSVAGESAHGTRKLETEVLGRFQVCVPPIGVQRAIVANIAAETAKLDALRSATERTIALLKERRAALIAAAVTGKIAIPDETRKPKECQNAI
jgi:type I restriction enzyme, S subunit